MRKASILVNNVTAGILEEKEEGRFIFQYMKDYEGAPVSLTMPTKNKSYEFNRFPPFL